MTQLQHVPAPTSLLDLPTELLLRIGEFVYDVDRSGIKSLSK